MNGGRTWLLTVGIAAGFALAHAALRWGRGPGAPGGRPPEAAGVLQDALAFLATLFLLKALTLVLPMEGLLREDGLYPLWALWDPAHAWWWAAPVLFLAGSVAISWWSGWLWRVHPAVFLFCVAAAAGAVWVLLSLIHGGWPDGLVRPFERDTEYLADVPRFASFTEIGSQYTARQADLSLHGKTHPPGAVAVLWMLDRLWGGRLVAICLSVVALGALALLPFYAWARLHLDPRGARVACVLWAATPSVLLYGATCMDMVFSVPLVLAGFLFARGLLRCAGADGDAGGAATVRQGALAGAVLAVAALYTFSAAVLAVIWMGVVGISALRARPRHLGPWVLLAAAGVSCALALLSLRLAGFDWFLSLRRALAIDALEAPAFLSPEYYTLTRLMGVLDFLVLAGVAMAPAWVGVLAGRRANGDHVDGARDAVLVDSARTAAGSLALFLLAGVYKIGETGRIGMFLLPFVIVPVVRRLGPSAGRAAAAFSILGLVQALLMELFLDTRW